MSEKATLLTSIPPVKKTSSSAGGPSSGNTGSESPLLKPTQPTSGASEPLISGRESSVAKSTQDTAVQGTEVVAVEVQSSETASITPFQGVIYVSFVLTFCLAGFAAVLMFRKGMKSAEQRFAQSSKFLGGIFVWAALSGFFGTYLYANYLNGSSDAAPLAWLMFFWVLAGPLVGVVLNHLLTPGQQAEKGRIIFDAIAYFVIFGAAMIAVVDGLKENAVLLFSLLGGFLFIVPVARFVSQSKLAKARHPELRETMDQVLIYSLLIIPGLFPILAFARVCGLSADAFVFLSNFLTFDFVLITTCTMLAALPDGDEVAPEDAAAQTEPEPAAKVNQAPAEPVKQSESTPVRVSAASASGGLKPKKLTPAKPPVKPSAGENSGSIPAAPQKPKRSESADSSAPNAPSRIKAPAKPKKRF